MKTETSSSLQSGESRRSFLKKTATLAAAASATGVLRTPVYGVLRTPVYGQPQAPSANVAGANSRIVIRVIGAGKQGTEPTKIFKAEASQHNIAVGSVCDRYPKHLDAAE